MSLHSSTVRLPLPSKLETERLLLQRVRYEDAEEIFFAYASKPEATRFVSWRTHRSVDDTRRFVRYAVDSWESGTEYTYVIRLMNRMLIGSIGVLLRDDRVQVGYVLSPVRWGRGYATEACSRIVTLLKPFAGIYRIGTFVDTENVASIRVLEKCGFVAEAVLPGWFRFVNQGNAARDCAVFRLDP